MAAVVFLAKLQVRAACQSSVKFPEKFILSPIPTHPATTTAPVVVLVEAVVSANTDIPVPRFN